MDTQDSRPGSAASRRAVVGLGALGAAALLTACGASRDSTTDDEPGTPGPAPPRPPGSPPPLDTGALPTMDYRGLDLTLDDRGRVPGRPPRPHCGLSATATPDGGDARRRREGAGPGGSVRTGAAVWHGAAR
ncbi:hypothetical protein [Actinomyces capricornis]|uniref:Uncharacterized protein n=1 Tax=Actinomyces capricornis TaxID=2755559 RepID=A0ABM7UCF5_9ACTO|nr:hypothetical protein [Actinomyces capricornis]BDA64928.1 hypothetical protein MANAM107_17620 [Actinomyces capricornis]